MNISVLLSASAVCALAVCASGDAATYGPYPGQTYVTCGNPAAKVAVALFHGNWANGTATQANVMQVCDGLAKAGMFVMNVNYRLAYTMPWPAQLDDAQLALRILRAKGYKSVGAAGTSAGGLISLMAGAHGKTDTTLATDPQREWDMWYLQNPRPDFVIDISGPADDVMEVNDGTPDGMIPLMHMPVAQAEATLSAVNYIDCHMAPTIVFAGVKDIHTGLDQARELVGKLAMNNVPFTYVPYPGSHVLNGLSVAEQNSYIAEAAEFALTLKPIPANGLCGK